MLPSKINEVPQNKVQFFMAEVENKKRKTVLL
jgi:hypothetical protein